jgi:hypothetical protein
MRKSLSLTAAAVLAISILIAPATAGIKHRPNNQGAGASQGIILQNHAKNRQLPPNPCKNKTACQ